MPLWNPRGSNNIQDLEITRDVVHRLAIAGLQRSRERCTEYVRTTRVGRNGMPLVMYDGRHVNGLSSGLRICKRRNQIENRKAAKFTEIIPSHRRFPRSGRILVEYSVF